MKRTIHITIDSDLVELAKIKRFKDNEFSLSGTINDFLRDLFEVDVENLEKEKLDMEQAEMEKKLALIKAQKQALEVEGERKEKEFWKKRGVVGKPEVYSNEDEPN